MNHIGRQKIMIKVLKISYLRRNLALEFDQLCSSKNNRIIVKRTKKNVILLSQAAFDEMISAIKSTSSKLNKK
jgi:PHD/YefM family antitoxin component YafN of YafNO toxin-antitoxin module